MNIKTLGPMIAGEWFEWEYPNKAPFLDVSAVVLVAANGVIDLDGLSIFTNYGYPANVGAALMKKMKRQFFADLKSQGFNYVILRGERLGGMAPGRKFKLTYKL